jgi:hypothetical protein
MYTEDAMANSRHLKSVIAFLLLLGISGCSSFSGFSFKSSGSDKRERAPESRVADRETRTDGPAQLTSLHIYSYVAQDTILTKGKAEKTGKIKGKALADLVNNLITDDGSSSGMRPVDEANRVMARLEPRKLLTYELNSAFRKARPYVVKNIHSAYTPLEDPVRHFNSGIPEDGILYADTSYFFTPDFRAVRIQTDLTLYLKSDIREGLRGNETIRPAYENTIIVHSDVVVDEGDAAKQAWLINGGYRLVQAMQEGLRETVRLVEEDVNKTFTPVNPVRRQTWYVVNDSKAGNDKVKGVLLEEHDDRFIIRARSGEIYSLPRQSQTAIALTE